MTTATSSEGQIMPPGLQTFACLICVTSALAPCPSATSNVRYEVSMCEEQNETTAGTHALEPCPSGYGRDEISQNGSCQPTGKEHNGDSSVEVFMLTFSVSVATILGLTGLC